jgi:5,10-methylenetetrahydrofolate reductase
MVSTDHFRHELLSQMSRAAALGRTNVLVTVGDLCGSVVTSHPLPAAMPCRRK